MYQVEMMELILLQFQETDIAGNAYSGTESLSFVIDNTSPLIQSVTVTDTNSKVILTYNEAIEELYDPTYFVSNFTVIKVWRYCYSSI